MKKIYAVLLILAISIIVICTSCTSPANQRLIDAASEKIWVSEEPLMWFHIAFGQVEHEGEILSLITPHDYGGNMDIFFCSDVYDEETGASMLIHNDMAYCGEGKYSESEHKMIFYRKDGAFKKQDSLFAQYESIEFIGYDEEAFAEKYPQFEFMTVEEYEQRNWPERYPEADIDKLLEESLWVCEEPLMWIKGSCGQIGIDDEITDIYVDALMKDFTITDLEKKYQDKKELLFYGDIYHNNLSGRLIATNSLNEDEYAFPQYRQMTFKEISEDEFTKKYPQFELFTLEEYEKENKVGDYREK